MLAPHELKGKAFTKSFKGYSQTEVDEYIEFLIQKYTELYKENAELERKLRLVVTSLDELKDEEAAIRSTLVSAQKMSDRIIKDANERADLIVQAVRDRCDAVIAEFRVQLRDEKKEMWDIRSRIVEFKKNVFELYGKHIEELQNLSVNEFEDIVLPNEDTIVSGIYTGVRAALEAEAETAPETKAADDDALLPEEPEEARKAADEQPEPPKKKKKKKKAADNADDDFIDTLIASDESAGAATETDGEGDATDGQGV